MREITETITLQRILLSFEEADTIRDLMVAVANEDELVPKDLKNAHDIAEAIEKILINTKGEKNASI